MVPTPTITRPSNWPPSSRLTAPNKTDIQLINDGAKPFALIFIDADKPNNPAYLAAALKLTNPGAVIVIDNVVRDGAVADATSADPRVQGVRRVTEDIAAHPELDATALQTVGEKGWDGLIIAWRH